MTEQNYNFRPDLQGLRAIAIILVILGHAGLDIVRGGFVGVDVFFVLSGYLITGLLLRELELRECIDFKDFYARRLKRLLPALIFMLLVSSALAVWLLSVAEVRAQLASSPFAATWSSNLYFTFTTINYFDELASRDLFLHTWSLGVEEQFYLIWPVMLLMLYPLTRMGRDEGGQSSGQLLGALVIIFISSFVLSLYWTMEMPLVAFYQMPSRIWQFAIGAIVYVLFQGGASEDGGPERVYNPLFSYLIFSLGLLLVVGSGFGFTPELAYPGFWALIPSIGAALLIGSGHLWGKGYNSPLAHPVLVWLGDRSYSLYLWHWPIMMLGFSLGFRDKILPILGMLSLSMLFAIISYRLVELPFWRGRWSHAKSGRVILVGILVMVGVIFSSYYGLKLLPKSNAVIDRINQSRQDIPEIYRLNCDAWYSSALVEPCVFQTTSARKTVVLLGDSIGAQWFSLVPEIYSPLDWRIVVLTKSSCAMVDEDYVYTRIGEIYQVCTDWRNAVLDKLDGLKPEVIIMGSSSAYNFTEDQWVEGTARILDRVSKTAGSVFIVPGTPDLGFDGPGCLTRYVSSDGLINRELCQASGRMELVGMVAMSLDKAASRYSNVNLLNLNDLVCPDDVCGAISKKGVVIFRDSQHLTDSFVRDQTSLVRERLKKYK